MNNKITFEGIEWDDFELEQALPKNVNIALSKEQMEVFVSRDVAPGPWQALFELIWKRLEGTFDCDMLCVYNVRFASEVENSNCLDTFEV